MKKISSIIALLAIIIVVAGLTAFLLKIKTAFAIFGIASVGETVLLTALVGFFLLEAMISVTEGYYMQGAENASR